MADKNKLEEKVGNSICEINKGNDIIGKLQKEVQSNKGKAEKYYKVILTQEDRVTEVEKTLHEKECVLDRKNTEIGSLKDKLDDTHKTLDEKNAKLDEAGKLVEQNHSMISWLNKELSEAKKDRLKPPVLPSGVVPGRPGASTVFKPSNTD